MKKKIRIKIGENVTVVSGKHRNNKFIVKKVDRKKDLVFLENVSRTISVLNKRERKRQTKEIFSSVHISNVRLVK